MMQVAAAKQNKESAACLKVPCSAEITRVGGGERQFVAFLHKNVQI